MNFDFETSEIIARAARAAKNADESMNFETMRELIKSSRRALETMHEKTEAEKQKNNETWSVNVAFAKNQELDADYNKTVKAIQENLSTALSVLVAAKHQALNDYVSEGPDTDMVNALTVLKIRGTDITEEELQIMSEKFAPNYQASNAFSKIVSEMGYTFIHPVSIPKTREILSLAEKTCLDAISHVGNFALYDDSRNLVVADVFISDANSIQARSTEIFRIADTNPALMIQQEKPTLRRRLEDEAAKAKAEGNFEKVAKISILHSQYNETQQGKAERDADRIAGIESRLNAIEEG